MAFGFVVAIVEEWHAFGHEMMPMPVVIVRRQFRQLLLGARAICFVDNEGPNDAD